MLRAVSPVHGSPLSLGVPALAVWSRALAAPANTGGSWLGGGYSASELSGIGTDIDYLPASGWLIQQPGNGVLKSFVWAGNLITCTPVWSWKYPIALASTAFRYMRSTANRRHRFADPWAVESPRVVPLMPASELRPLPSADFESRLNLSRRLIRSVRDSCANNRTRMVSRWCQRSTLSATNRTFAGTVARQRHGTTLRWAGSTGQRKKLSKLF